MRWPLQVEDTFLLQLGYDFLPLALHIAHGVLGVDVGNDPREAVALVELGVDAQHHLHPGMELLPGDALEVGLCRLPHALPAFGRGACYGLVMGSRRCGGEQRQSAKGRRADGGGTVVILDKLHVAVATAFPDLRQLSLNPVFGVEAQLQGLPDEHIQLIESERVARGGHHRATSLVPLSAWEPSLCCGG